MKAIIYAAIGALLTLVLLPGCSYGALASTGAAVVDASGVPAPATVANRTVIDEQAMLAVELAYKAERLAIETGVDAGIIKGARATQAAQLDNQAYLAVTIARSAYNTANAPDYVTALTTAQQAIAAAVTGFGKGN